MTDVERTGDRFHLIHITVPASAVLILLIFQCNVQFWQTQVLTLRLERLSVQLAFTHCEAPPSWKEEGVKTSPATTTTTTWMCWPTNSFSHLVHSVESTTCSLRFLIYLPFINVTSLWAPLGIIRWSNNTFRAQSLLQYLQKEIIGGRCLTKRWVLTYWWFVHVT